MTRQPEYESDKHLMSVAFDVESGKVREFSRAVHAADRIHYSKSAAQVAGFESIVAAPTFVVSSAHWCDDGQNANSLALEVLGVDPSSVLLGSSDWVFRRPILAGDHLVGTSRIVSTDWVVGQSSGRMRRIMVESRFTVDDEECVRYTSTLLAIDRE